MDKAINSKLFKKIILVVKNKKELKKKYTDKVHIINGGKERSDSSLKAINYIKKFNPTNVLIHDGARPNFSNTLLINLIKNTKIILKNSISLGGSSIKDFSNADGRNGNFQQKFNVYGRENNNCLTKGCSGLIKKIYVSNRSTFFCSYCQK